jgi:hypothetical protein
MGLLDNAESERSATVADCRMNRGRDLVSSDGYDRELGFNPLDSPGERNAPGRLVARLVHCGSPGEALIEVARFVHADGTRSQGSILSHIDGMSGAAATDRGRRQG